MPETSAPRTPLTGDIEQRLKCDILPLFRTRSRYLTYWRANAYGSEAHGGVDELRAAAASGGAATH
ncbi:hypothetical protein [Agromyces bauzanensis]|uniref:Uncharacterized protein n=1 Tax=Agromyces bauzanensis TaxID=1308924 RepID=A0A917PVP9_9MICO|nr:hypothetical protein [Agromyces bauzanensis]GGJ93853.1 hypothetical protein GCM10011372_35360 [Agromyces bauzanensis]